MVRKIFLCQLLGFLGEMEPSLVKKIKLVCINCHWRTLPRLWYMMKMESL